MFALGLLVGVDVLVEHAHVPAEAAAAREGEPDPPHAHDPDRAGGGIP